jgi:hypothetical protein
LYVQESSLRRNPFSGIANGSKKAQRFQNEAQRLEQSSKMLAFLKNE